MVHPSDDSDPGCQQRGILLQCDRLGPHARLLEIMVQRAGMLYILS